MDIKYNLNLYAKCCEDRIEAILSRGMQTRQKKIFESMLYSAQNGGKRIRPALLFMFYRIFDPVWQKAADFAAALEMVHTYSLIHDDLPCMDDDDMRRGKPSNHKMFGENIAVLSGDALLNTAFETVLTSNSFSADRVKKAALVLANCSGTYGMLGGQVIDVTEKLSDVDSLTSMYALKTGALLSCACRIGVILGGGTDEQVNAADAFGINLGIAFQIIDDILDAVGDEKILGKKIGSDEKLEKVTYVTLLGLDGARAAAKEYTDKCVTYLSEFYNTDEVKLLADYLLCREY